MTHQNVAALVLRLREDSVLRQKVATTESLQDILEIFSESGFEISPDDWLAFKAHPGRFLSDEEIEGLAGGKYPTGFPAGYTESGWQGCG